VVNHCGHFFIEREIIEIYGYKQATFWDSSRDWVLLPVLSEA
jgi:hypothetical protein